MHSDIRKYAENNHSFFLYDLETVERQINSLQSLPRNVEVFYAMKANPHPDILQKMINHPKISGIEIASQGEAEKVLEHTHSLERVIYTSPAKREEELRFVINKKIRCINVESLTEAHRINKIAQKPQQVLLRINTNKEIHGAATNMSSSTEPSPFGISEDEAYTAVQKIKSLSNLDLQGVHIFSASGVLSAQALADHVDYALDLASRMERETQSVFQTIDFGGGIGIDYEGNSQFDVSLFSSKLSESIAKHNMESRKMILELGRYLVADAGYFCTEIVDIKESRGQKMLICASGTNSHRRPYALKINYQAEILPTGKTYKYPDQLSCRNEMVQIRGPLCTEADILSRKNFVQQADIGDFVVMKKAGAYGATMSHRDFLSHPHIPEFVIQ